MIRTMFYRQTSEICTISNLDKDQLRLDSVHVLAQVQQRFHSRGSRIRTRMFKGEHYHCYKHEQFSEQIICDINNTPPNFLLELLDGRRFFCSKVRQSAVPAVLSVGSRNTSRL